MADARLSQIIEALQEVRAIIPPQYETLDRVDAAISLARSMEKEQGGSYVLELLVAAGHVTPEKVEQAREIARSLPPHPEAA